MRARRASVTTAPGVLHLIVDRVARYLIRDGKEIVIDRDPEANDDDVRLFRFGSAFDSLIHPRGILAQHGSVIVVGSGCVVFLGHSGAGKSTLTNAFRNTSHSILADDICATVISESGAIEVLPAYQVIVNALRTP